MPNHRAAGFSTPTWFCSWNTLDRFVPGHRAVVLYCQKIDTLKYSLTTMGSRTEQRDQTGRYCTANAKGRCSRPLETKVNDRHVKGCTPQNIQLEEESKDNIKELVTNELSKIVELTLDDILHMSYHNSQSCISSVVFNVNENVMLDLLRTAVIR